MADEVASEGKWLDTKSNQIVTSAPEEGVQLVAEGSPITPEVKATVERYEAAIAEQADVETAADTGKAPDGGDPAKTVTTASTSSTSRSKGS